MGCCKFFHHLCPLFIRNAGVHPIHQDLDNAWLLLDGCCEFSHRLCPLLVRNVGVHTLGPGCACVLHGVAASFREQDFQSEVEILTIVDNFICCTVRRILFYSCYFTLLVNTSSYLQKSATRWVKVYFTLHT